MAQVVMIETNTRTKTDGSPLSEIGDIVSVYDDGTIDPDSIGYTGFRVIHIPYTRQQVEKFFDSIRDKMRELIQDELEYEVSPGVWQKIKAKAKYLVNLNDITDADITKLKGADLTLQQKTALLKSRIRSCIENQITYLLDD